MEPETAAELSSVPYRRAGTQYVYNVDCSLHFWQGDEEHNLPSLNNLEAVGQRLEPFSAVIYGQVHHHQPIAVSSDCFTVW